MPAAEKTRRGGWVRIESIYHILFAVLATMLLGEAREKLFWAPGKGVVLRRGYLMLGCL